jgi:hypothetical protein
MLAASLQTGSSAFSDFAPHSASWTSGSGGRRQGSFASDLANLVTSIQSGNASNAQEYLTKVEKLVPSIVDSKGPLGTFLSGVSSALSNNDISSAQTALSAFENRRAPSSTSGSATTATSPPASSSGGSTTNALGQDVLSLFTAIGSGNLQGAQSAYDQVTSLLLGGSISLSSSNVSTPGAASTASAPSTPSPASTGPSSGPFSNAAPFVTLLSQIGSALSTSDIDTAQTAVDSFLQTLTSGSLVGATA